MNPEKRQELLHHLKNILQGVISYINALTRNRPTIEAGDIRNIVNLLHIQARAQDLLFDNPELDTRAPLKINPLIEYIIEAHKQNCEISVSELPEMSTGIKKAVNLCIVLSELITWAKTYGSAPINIELTESADGQIRFSLRKEICDESINSNENGGAGLALAKAIVQGDHKSRLIFLRQNGELRADFAILL